MSSQIFQSNYIVDMTLLPIQNMWTIELQNDKYSDELYSQGNNFNINFNSSDKLKILNEDFNKVENLPATPPPVPVKFISGTKTLSRRTDSNINQDKDPETRLIRNLRAYYRDISSGYVVNEFLTSCASMFPPEFICPAYFEPELEVHFGECKKNIKISEILSPITFKKNLRQEAPRKILIEGEPGVGKTSTVLKLLHCWATQNDWLGPAINLILFIPLNELHDRSLFHYIINELLPNISEEWSSTNSLNEFKNLWEHTFVNLEDKLLFVLDGFENISDKNEKACKDVYELITSRLFPKSRVVITSRPSTETENLFVNRKLKILGRQWSQVKKLLNIYFSEHNEEEIEALIGVIDNSDNYLKQLAQSPVGWLCVCLLFEYCNKTLPNNKLELYEKMIQCLISKKMRLDHSNTIDNIDLIMNDLGKYALSTLRTPSRDKIKKNQMIEFGLLNKTLNFGFIEKRQQGLYQYNFIHNSFAEYLSAFYIYTSLKTDSELKTELQNLPGIKENGFFIDIRSISILQFLMGLMRSRAHLIFTLLEPKDFPVEFFITLPKYGGAFEKNILKVCELLGFSKFYNNSFLTSNDTYPRINLTPVQLKGWSQIVVSNFCNVTNFELFYQPEDKANSFLDMFLEALNFNESIISIRVLAIFDKDYKEMDLKYFTNCISKLLKKPNLKSFTLIISNFNDKHSEDISYLVKAICSGLENAKSLQKLSLDMNLDSSGIIQICKIVKKLPNISILHIPCSCFNIESSQQFNYLLSKFFLTELNISGSWSISENILAENTIDLESMNIINNNKKEYHSIFEDVNIHKVLRSNSLPKHRTTKNILNENIHWNKSFDFCNDSLNKYCSIFQTIFASIQHPLSILTHLIINKCSMMKSDLHYLYECIAKPSNLRILSMENYSSFYEILPVFKGIVANSESHLTKLNFASSKMILNDLQLQFVLQSLTHYTKLRSLNLNGWIYHIEEIVSMSMIHDFLLKTSLSDLSMINCRVELKSHLNYDQVSKLITIIKNKSIQIMNVQGFQIVCNKMHVFGVEKLSNFLNSFLNLQDINLNSDTMKNRIINEDIFINCFKTIMKLENLKKLSIENWIIFIQNKAKTFKNLRTILKNCTLNSISLKNCTIYDKKKSLEHLFIKLLFAHLKRIIEINLIQIPFNTIQMKFLLCVLKTFSSVGQTTIFIDNYVINFIINSLQNSNKLRIVFVNGQNHIIKIDKF